MAYTDKNKNALLDEFYELANIIGRQTCRFREREANAANQKDLSQEIDYLQGKLRELDEWLWAK